MQKSAGKMNTAYGFFTFYRMTHTLGITRIIISLLLALSTVFLVSSMSSNVAGFVMSRLSVELANIPAPEEVVSVYNDDAVTEVTVRQYDTLRKILYNHGFSDDDVGMISDAIKHAKINLVLHPGDKITFETASEDNEDGEVTTTFVRDLVIQLDKVRQVVVSRVSQNAQKSVQQSAKVAMYYKDGTYVPNAFVAREVLAELTRSVSRHVAEISASGVIESLRKIGIASAHVNELVHAYSHNVDFQRDIHAGDKVEVLVEKYYTSDGEFIRSGRVLFASLSLANKKRDIYWFQDGNGQGEYFSNEGSRVKHNLLRTPISVGRISSGYGKRQHPIDGYTKMHKGVDFPAPYGTQILSAGTGVVTSMGWKSGYGRYIQIKHSASLSTAYAHASAFAKNLKVGDKVKQGQVIAYVGTSGHTTGSHLHYEVKVNGIHVNPTTVHTFSDGKLQGDKLRRFQNYKNQLRDMVAKS